MNIDFELAKKIGATHYRGATNGLFKKKGDDWFFWDRVELEWIKSINPVDYDNKFNFSIIPEPNHGALDGREGVEWDVEGLPPVGVECEVYGILGLYNQWHKCRVFAVELGQVFITNGKCLANRRIDSVQFRPLENKEQKAARDIDELAESLHRDFCLGAGIQVAKFELLPNEYQAGWRAVAKVKLDNK